MGHQDTECIHLDFTQFPSCSNSLCVACIRLCFLPPSPACLHFLICFQTLLNLIQIVFFRLSSTSIPRLHQGLPVFYVNARHRFPCCVIPLVDSGGDTGNLYISTIFLQHRFSQYTGVLNPHQLLSEFAMLIQSS